MYVATEWRPEVVVVGPTENAKQWIFGRGLIKVGGNTLHSRSSSKRKCHRFSCQTSYSKKKTKGS